jgi:hypothetical protein
MDVILRITFELVIPVSEGKFFLIYLVFEAMRKLYVQY